jgi:hypothetical protein
MPLKATKLHYLFQLCFHESVQRIVKTSLNSAAELEQINKHCILLSPQFCTFIVCKINGNSEYQSLGYWIPELSM